MNIDRTAEPLTGPIAPVYYVAHPDGSYSTASPQPVIGLQPKPLSESMVHCLRCAVPGGEWFDFEQAEIFERGIRAAERAHGITGKEQQG